MTGPYSLVNPKHPVTTPYTYFEAPILMPKPGNKGWMIFSERYPHEYVRFDAEHIEAENGKFVIVIFPTPDTELWCV